jgi:hypothetical protein
MGWLSRLFRAKSGAGRRAMEQEVEIRFAYGSTNFQYVYALGDQLRIAVGDAKVGEYDGHSLTPDGSEGKFFIYGPDAEVIFRMIQPILVASQFMRGAKVTLWFGPPKWRTPKRIIHLP